MKDACSLTVLVATYHPVWEKLKRTLRSILLQKNVDYEILVCDDGSEVNFFEQIETFFQENRFEDYQLLSSPENEGTCRNCYKGLERAKGKYTKIISQSDYLYDENVLASWVRFMDEKKAVISFGAPVFFNETGALSVRNQPQHPERYDGNFSYKNTVLNYVLLQDSAVGCALMTDTKLTKEYMGIIMKSIKFTEDTAYKLMALEGIPIYYFPQNVVWYEYGTGISSGKSSKWAHIIEDETCTLEHIAADRMKDASLFGRKLKKVLKRSRPGYREKIFKCIVFPELFVLKLKNSLFEQKSEADADTSFSALIQQI